MGHDEDKNNFDTGGTSPTPVTPNPRATITSGNRLGMRTSRNVSAAQAELDRISADSNPNAVPSPTTGDIVLNNNTAKKEKKSIKRILAISAVAIIAAVIVVSLVVSTSKKIFKPTPLSETHAKLLNYLISEEEKTETPEKIADINSTALAKHFGKEEDQAYFSNVDRLLKSFETARLGSSDRMKASTEELIASYNSVFEILRTVQENGATAEKTLLSEFLSGVNLVEKASYDRDNISDAVEDYYAARLDYYTAAQAYYSGIKSIGCIRNNAIDENCVYAFPVALSFDIKAEEMTVKKEKLEKIEKGIVGTVLTTSQNFHSVIMEVEKNEK